MTEITEVDKINLMASPNWIKYIQCKNCKLCYQISIASNPCIKCGGHDFEQFDLILYPMTLEQKQQILDGQKALEELPTLTESREYWKDLCNTNIKQKYTLFEENQKLKAEIEELKRQLQK